MNDTAERWAEHSHASMRLLRDATNAGSIIAALTAIDGLRYVAGWRFEILTDAESVTVIGHDPSTDCALRLTEADLQTALNNWVMAFGLAALREVKEEAEGAG